LTFLGGEKKKKRKKALSSTFRRGRKGREGRLEGREEKKVSTICAEKEGQFYSSLRGKSSMGKEGGGERRGVFTQISQGVFYFNLSKGGRERKL